MSIRQAHEESHGSGDHYDDNSGSDEDLDLAELDPVTSSVFQARQIGSSNDFAARVPLRNLRPGGRRRRIQEHEQDDQDLEALVSPASRRNRPSLSYPQDDAPLLSGGRLRRFSHQPAGSLQDLTRSKAGLWRYLPFSQRRQSPIALPDGVIEDNEVEHDGMSARTIDVGQKQGARYPPNAISNTKYTPWSFLPRTLFNEFKFFFNLYFLLVALSQIIPALRIGYLLTYIAPLGFVLSITLGKEAYDDVYRRKRDAEANGEAYKVLQFWPADSYEDIPTSGKRKISERKKEKKRKAGAVDNRRLDALAEEEDSTEAADKPSAWVETITKPARDLRVGDVVVLSKDQRIPADVIMLKSFSPSDGHSQEARPAAQATSPTLLQEASQGASLDNETSTADPSGGGEAFIRTDQLDGETDWKLRLASSLSQTLPSSEYVRLRISAGAPDRKVNDFVGTIELLPKHIRNETNGQNKDSETKSISLTIDHAAWANTVLASGTVVHAVIVYTGSQTRAALSTSASRSKNGLLELEINSLTKILCFLTAFLSVLLVALERLQTESSKSSIRGGTWYVDAMRFLILFSSIVPISLRVNLDMGKSVYAYLIHRDAGIPNTIVRTSTIPEDLGRIEYLLSDKTGTLTRNEMVLRKIHIGTVSYGGDAIEEVISFIKQAFSNSDRLFSPSDTFATATSAATRSKREIGMRVRDLVLALGVCHNVTPTSEEDANGQPVISYQASSPDEIAIVQWTEHVGLRLAQRDRQSISLQYTGTGRTVVSVQILNVFPFTSDSKRMGIIVRFQRDAASNDGEIVFYQKGADTVMESIVVANDWLEEETGNMAREGLRTLVVARRSLSAEQYSAFTAAYTEASLNLSNREAEMASVVKRHLEHDLELLGVTGVEDKLQPNVKPSLELLRNAGIKIWMLTGDKVETARCVAISSKLVSRGQHIHTIAGLKRKDLALDALAPLSSRPNSALLIDGQSLALYLAYHRQAFISAAVRLPVVIACRCSPMQKASVALLIRAYTKKRTACIGDGGNDVSMIQAADVGIGIVGKEGRQASLAADFSITQFAHLTKLIVWHGRNSYKRSAKLAQFVMHRGLIISVAQTVFSAASRFEPVALYRDWLLVGYATLYTMMPVFSLVLDRDVDEGLANLYPELYKELTDGRSLSYKTFFVWVAISLYQGIVIQLGSQILVPGFSSSAPTTAHPTADTGDTGPFAKMVLLSYSALITNEIIMVAASVTTWHPVMLMSIFATLGIYFGSLPFLASYFDLGWLLTLSFWWRFGLICGASLVPVWGGRVIKAWIRPPSYRKIQG